MPSEPAYTEPRYATRGAGFRRYRARGAEVLKHIPTSEVGSGFGGLGVRGSSPVELLVVGFEVVLGGGYNPQPFAKVHLCGPG